MTTNLFSLWPHQDTGIAEIERAWSSGIKSVCYQLPTGGGKSRVIRQIVDNHSAGKKIIYLIAHRSTLVKQLSDELDDIELKHGIIAAGYPHLRYRVQVCSIQTMVNRLDRLDPPEILIFDEAHHCKAKSFLRIINRWPAASILGVTATPLRLDGKSLSDIFDTLVTGPAMHDLIEDGYLSDYEYYAPDTVDMSGVHKRAGEFVQSEVTSRVDKRVIIGSAVEHYRRYADGLPGIACCVNIAHAEHVAEQFAEAGYRARAVHSKQDKKYIEESIAGLKNGTLDILCQCELLGEGVDIKGAAVLIQLRPTASLTIFLQHVGRVLRFVLGKRAIILDHVGNWERHGLPDDNRDWNLDGRPVTAGDVSELKRCPGCLRPVKRTVRACPHCGYLFNDPAVQELPKEVTGELINIRDRKLRGNLVIDIARRADTLQQAIAVAKEHGAKHTQAWHIWTHELKKSC